MSEGVWSVGYLTMPNSVHVSCPRCGARADFVSAFRYVSAEENEHLPIQTPGARRVRSGSDYIEEVFPNEFPWKDPDNSLARDSYVASQEMVGVVRCASCVLRKKHVLNWPSDAFYRVETPVGVLWAWDRALLVAARDYVQSEKRSLGAHGDAYLFLRAIPKEFLLVRNRARVVQSIDRKLQAEKG